MAQYLFGAGTLWGIPTADSSGTAITIPTPVQFGTLQSGTVDFGYESKKLYGGKSFPAVIGRGKGSITGKASFGQVNGALINSLFFGMTETNSIVSDYVDTTGAAIPTTPFTITPTPPNSGVWSVDLGVIDSNGLFMTRVASAPTTGQYSVTAGAYLFAAADASKVVYISYQYTGTSTSAGKIAIVNTLMGYSPTFKAELYVPFQGKSMIITLNACVSSKLSFATKLDDFALPAFDFEASADAAGNVGTIALTEK